MERTNRKDKGGMIMAKTNKMVTGLIAGAAMGAVAGLLFAPKSGKESRQIVAARANKLRNKV